MKFSSLLAIAQPVCFGGLVVAACGGPATLAAPPLPTATFLLGVPPARVFTPDSLPIVALGKKLFFDKRLSRDSSISCGSCHIPEQAFAEPRRVSHGIGPNARIRNTPTLFNVAFEPLLDWDGRATTLEEQLLGVFSSNGDMGIDIGEAILRVRRDVTYDSLFRILFGKSADTEAVTKSIATFERSLVIGHSRFDRYFFAGDSTALSPAQQRGWRLFQNVGCAGCHKVLQIDPRGDGIAMFNDGRFHNLGIGYANGRMVDVGRYAVTRRADDWGAFKTPTLRNVALTAPYMHDGSLRTLVEVVDFYNRGGTPNPNIDAIMRPLFLAEPDQADLVAFLEALTSDVLRDENTVRNVWGAVRQLR
jgi:cytochrome c peroxidase